MNKTQRRRQTVVVTLLAGSANNVIAENQITFDRKFDRCIGVTASARSGGGAFAYQLGFLNPRETPVDLADGSLLISGNSVAPDQKFASLGTSGVEIVDGEINTVQVKNVSGAPTGADLVIEFTFLLEKDLIVQ